MPNTDYDAYQLFVPFLDFLVRYGMFSEKSIEKFKELLSEAGFTRGEEAAVGQFLAQLEHIRREGKGNIL
jgi:hypothetical protein